MHAHTRAGVPPGSGRYPFPLDAPIEGAYPGCSMTACNTDRHVIAIDNATCILYEAWRCQEPPGPAGEAGCHQLLNSHKAIALMLSLLP
jgi:hypothetical protein